MQKTNTESLEKIKKNHAIESKIKYPKQILIFKSASIKQKIVDFANNTWHLKASREADIDNYLPLEIAWITPDQQTAIHYIEDWYLEDGTVYPFSLKTPL